MSVSCRVVEITYETVVVSCRLLSLAEDTRGWCKGFYDLEVNNLDAVGHIWICNYLVCIALYYHGYKSLNSG